MKYSIAACLGRSKKENLALSDSTMPVQTSEEPPGRRNFDDYLKKLNNFGRFQQVQWMLLFVTTIPQAWYSYVPVFSAMKVDPAHVRCAYGNGTIDVCNIVNGTQCMKRIYEAPFTSIITDYDMFCDSKLKMAMTKSVFYIGKLIGAYFFGWLSDRYGRLLPLLSSAAVQFVASLCTTFATNYYVFTALRFPLGVCSGGNFMAAFILATEIVGPNHRNFANAFMQSGFGIGVGFQAIIAYVLPKWEHHNLAITLPNLLLITYYWLVTESPRWQLAKGRREQAGETLKQLAKSNGKDFDPKEWASVRQSENINQHKRYNLRHLFKTKYLRKITLIEGYSWLVVVLVYYGLGFNSSNLSGNVYLNFAATGLIEIPAYITAAFLVNITGRRIPGCLYYVLGGLSLLAIVPIELTGNKDKYAKLILALSLIGKFMASAAFYQVYIHTAELYPTVIRNVGLGVASATGRIGGIIAPIVTDGAPKYIPPLIFGITSIVAGLLRLLLPETKNMALPEAFEDEIGLEKKNDDELLEKLNETA